MVALTSCAGRGHPQWIYSTRYLLLLVVFGIFCLLQGTYGLIIANGTYILCGSSPEQTAQHTTGSIVGGVDTVHQFVRLPCDIRTENEIRYRTYDGTCNSEGDRGASFNYVKRYMEPHFQGPVDSGPRVWSYLNPHRLLPSARAVSRSLHGPKPSSVKRFTLLLMQIGQLLDHDLSIVPIATERDSTIHCCFLPPEERYHDCFPIEVPADDANFHECMEFVRSDPLTFPNGTIPQPRSFFNTITAYVDASMVYGSDPVRAKDLRTHNGTGALLKTKMFNGQERLPEGHKEDCINLSPHHFCTMAGDDRVNEQPGLTSIHTVFHLEHNRQVRNLAKVILYRTGRPFSPQAVDDYLDSAPQPIQERLYQVVRKIMGAVWQNVVYNEYIPLIVGPELMNVYKLRTGRRIRFDPEVDPSIAIEFLTAAFRYGHTLVNDMMLTDKMNTLKEMFSTSKHYLENYPNVMKGLVTPINHAEDFDTNIADSLNNHLFENNKEGRPGLDLAALNIQRGRDHGLASFNKLREFFGLTKFKQWSDFGEENGQKLSQLYDHPDDVDCFTGGTSERPMEGGVVGELFAHIIAQQFHDLKYGDRYFFETSSAFFGFRSRELSSLKRLCLNKIICENSDLGFIQVNPFLQPNYFTNPEYRCQDYQDINMWPFSHDFV